MSSTDSAAHGHDGEHAGEHKEGGHHHIHPPSHYVKIWGILTVLFFISVAGPMIGIKIVTLMTAFGIAIVKAYLVCSYFMHLNIEKKWVVYLELGVLALLALFWFAVAPDVMEHQGHHWENVAAKEETARRMAEHAAGAAHGEHGGGEHGGSSEEQH